MKVNLPEACFPTLEVWQGPNNMVMISATGWKEAFDAYERAYREAMGRCRGRIPGVLSKFVGRTVDDDLRREMSAALHGMVLEEMGRNS